MSDLPPHRTIASTRQWLQAGVSRSTLSRRVKAGQLLRVTGVPGLYARPGREPHAEEDVIRVALRAPHAVMCLLTAMRLHNMRCPPAGEVWIAVSNKGRPPRMKAPPIRVVHMEAKALGYGIDEMCLDGVKVLVTNHAKTVADGFKYRRLIGARAATQALQSCLEQGLTKPDEIWAAAEIDRVTALVGPLLEAFS